MKLIRKKSTSGAESMEDYEIPNSTVTIGAILLAVIQIVGTLLGNVLTSNPKRQTDKEAHLIKEKNFQVQLFQRVLEQESAQARASSIYLLIASGLLQDKDSMLSEIAADSSKVPKWDKRPLEPFHAGAVPYMAAYAVNNNDTANPTSLPPSGTKKSAKEPMER